MAGNDSESQQALACFLAHGQHIGLGIGKRDVAWNSVCNAKRRDLRFLGPLVRLTMVYPSIHREEAQNQAVLISLLRTQTPIAPSSGTPPSRTPHRVPQPAPR